MNGLTIFILLFSIIVSINADNDVTVGNSCATDGCVAGLYCSNEVCTQCNYAVGGGSQTCSAGSHVSATCAAGSTSDGSACTACTAITGSVLGSYSTEANVASCTNRVACTGNGYYTSASTTSVGNCNDCSGAHTGNKYVSTVCLNNADTQYTDFTTCDAGSKVTVVGTKGSATATGSNPTCVACTGGTNYNTDDNEWDTVSSCTACTQPGTGKYVSAACTASTNTVLADAGNCDAGTRVQTATVVGSISSAGSNIVCEACTVGTNYDDTDDKTSVGTCTACGGAVANKYVSTICSASANTQYTDCTSSETNKYTSTVCAAGSATATGTDTVFTDCGQCAAGNYVSTICDAGSDSATGTATQCTACTVGTNFMASASTNHGSATTSCTACTASEANKYVSTSCTTTTDTIFTACGNCAAGKYVSTTCDTGSADTTGTATVCTDCTVGSTYTDAASTNHGSATTSCTVCTNCAAGKYTATVCIATADTVCTICAAHTYKDAADTAANTVTTCTNCPSGTENTDAATSEGNHDAAADCSVCTSSKYSVSGSACVGCPVGTSMAAHASDGAAYDGSNAGEHDSIIDCIICAAHSYQDTAGSASCDSCAAGKDLVNTYGGQACDEENVGSCTDGTSTTKTACETAGETWTAACDATNGASGSDAATDCTDCSAGKYGPGNVECADCVLSNTATFETDTGLATNDECAAATCDTGYVLSGTTPDRCNDCDTGYSVSGNACQCAVDYHVQNNECVECATGTWRNAGDVFSGNDTECNSGGNTANKDDVPDSQGIEALEPDSKYMQKVVYSLGGSLHRNKYGYLVDNNGLLLIGEGKSSDVNAKHHLHVPSRYNDVYFDGNGKIWVVELNGAVYTNIGTIKLARFENTYGLNKFQSITSHCIPEDNEFGFMLGSWCSDTWLDGLKVDYMDVSLVSGPGIVGNPLEQGFGRIIKGKEHQVSSFLRGQFYKNKTPGWSIKIDGRGYFQYRYIVEKLTSDQTRYDQGGTGDGSYNSGYFTGSTRI